MKKLLALLLALLMVAGLLAGCSNSGEENNPSSEPGNTGSNEPTSAPTYTGPVGGDEELPDVELPLTENNDQFICWIGNGQTFQDFSTYDDNLFYQWMEEQTGVDLVFNHPASGSEREAFQTMVLSGDYPDFVQSVKNYYDGGVDKAIKDEFLVALNDAVDQWMPHYRRMVYADETTFIQAVSDEGNLWAVHHIVDVPQGAWVGLGIRQDWLDRAGIDVSVAETMEGLESILTTFKDYTYDNNGPLWMEGGSSYFGMAIIGSYGVSGTNFSNGIINENGTAVYSPLKEGYKQYAAQMQDWYNKGLIHNAYVATASFSTPEDRWANSEVGVGNFIYTNLPTLRAAAANSSLQAEPDFNLSALTTPKLTADQSWDDIHLRNNQDKIRNGNSMGITTGCKNLELACKFWDYAWTDEGKIASNWGPVLGDEGDTTATYFIDESDSNHDGHKECYQQWQMDYYGNVTNIQYKVAVHNGPTYSIWSREWCMLTEQEIEYQNIWNRVKGDWVWPEGVTLTTQEGNDSSSPIANAQSACNEWLVEVITQNKSVDTYETELVPQLESMGIADALQLYQNALSRYYARSQYIDD